MRTSPLIPIGVIGKILFLAFSKDAHLSFSIFGSPLKYICDISSLCLLPVTRKWMWADLYTPCNKYLLGSMVEKEYFPKISVHNCVLYLYSSVSISYLPSESQCQISTIAFFIRVWQSGSKTRPSTIKGVPWTSLFIKSDLKEAFSDNKDPKYRLWFRNLL